MGAERGVATARAEVVKAAVETDVEQMAVFSGGRSLATGWETPGHSPGAQGRVDAMVGSAERVLELARFPRRSDARWSVFSASSSPERHGMYAEFGLRALAEVLTLPSVLESIEQQPSARFVDFGSGAGRLLLGAAAMAEWGACTGIEAVAGLHQIACDCIGRAESAGALSPGLVSSLHVDGLPHESPEVMTTADVCFIYSTAFPTAEDGLRLPELSASLASVLKAGSLVVTTDTLLVGGRFRFEQHKLVEGDEGERLQCDVWRVVGSPALSYDDAYAEVQAQCMGDDALMQDEKLCEALEVGLEAVMSDLEKQ